MTRKGLVVAFLFFSAGGTAENADSMTLGNEQSFIHSNAETGNESFSGRPDEFTKLIIRTDRHPKTFNELVVWRQTLEIMKNSHCAIQAIGKIIESGEVRVDFGDSWDMHGHYSNGVITINKNRDYLYDPENLAKALYHEGLHHVEIKLGLRSPGETGQYHDSTRIPIILRHLLGPNNKCLNLIRSDGTLLGEDGRPLEAGMQPATKPALRAYKYSPILDPALLEDIPKLSLPENWDK